jgi:methylase of polypeptide subunit release factors
VSKFTDQQYLKSDQYKDSSNLDARVVIHQRFSTNSYGWFKWVFDTLLKLPEDARMLELGCGPGLLWRENIDRIPSGWNITLSDLSSGMLDAAWRNLVVTGRAFQFKEIEASDGMVRATKLWRICQHGLVIFYARKWTGAIETVFSKRQPFAL